jgi:hypothetical protein
MEKSVPLGSGGMQNLAIGFSRRPRETISVKTGKGSGQREVLFHSVWFGEA